jgi:hypothetical protein
MGPYGIDYHERLRHARAHATELRTDWGMANGRDLSRAIQLEKPCGTSLIEFTRRAAGRLTELGRRPGLVRQDPCS